MLENQPEPSAALETIFDALFAKARTVMVDGSFYQEVAPFVESDHLDTSSIFDLLQVGKAEGKTALLDFGCGAGAHRGMLESFGYDWFGIDYAPTVSQDAQPHEKLRFYNGIDIPFPDNTFDVVFSFLVFEHIQDIHASFADIKRVLRPGGLLLGQVAYLEQIHDFSSYNFTPIGMKIACEKAGLTLERIHPAHDAFTYLFHRLSVALQGTDDTPFLGRFSTDNKFNRCISALDASPLQKNMLKLMFSTHFLFQVRNVDGVALS